MKVSQRPGKTTPGEILGSSYISTDEATTSTTPVDLTTADTVTFTLDVAGTVFALWFANVYNSSAAKNNRDTVLIDGVEQVASRYDSTAPAANNGLTVSFMYKIASVAVGSHTIKIQHSCPEATTAHWRNRTLIIVRG